MKAKICVSGLATFGLAAAFPAHAQDEQRQATGPYAAASFDISMLQNTHGTIDNAPVPGSSIETYNPTHTGVGGSLAIGYDFGSWRLELEGGYARNHDSSYTAIVPPTGEIQADVKRTSWRGMVNAYYDFSAGGIEPYVGVGAGILSGKVDFFAPRAPFPTEAPRQLINSSDTRFAYSLMAGFSLPVSERVKLTAQYRWLDAGTLHPLDSRGERTSYGYRSHNIDLGVRVGF